MKELSENGEYTISSEELAEIRSLFTGLYASDEEGAAAIKEEFESDHYLMDTHTAIAWSCMNKYRDTEEGNAAAAYVVLSTASPYKFSRAVLEALGEDASGTDRENMEKCHKITGAPVPAGLAGVFDREVRHEDVIETAEMRSYVVENC
jgi:threonine synthase